MKNTPNFGEIRCKECERLFKPKSGNALYCSAECRRSARRKRELENYRNEHPNARTAGISTNDFEIIDDMLKITTSNGNIIFADASDANLLMRFSWCVSKNGYAVAYVNGRIQRMHRIILGDRLSDEDDVDHINRIKLDNRRKNIRICSREENLRNSGKRNNNSGHTGVTVLKNGRFRASITLNKKQIHLGVYDTMDEAVQARLNGERKYHGSFARHIGNELENSDSIYEKGK